PYMVRYEDEITMTVKDEQNFLDAAINDPKKVMIAAFISGKLVADIGLYGVEPFERFRHRAGLGMAIYREFWGLGIGSALLGALIEFAWKAGYEQLELEVISDNERAVALYEKFGFEIFGTRKNTLKYRDGHYSGAYLMMKKL
ncbi:MAG: GNAT family N-acetyltransferase, partial [Oscillospiraceae bacterium]